MQQQQQRRQRTWQGPIRPLRVQPRPQSNSHEAVTEAAPHAHAACSGQVVPHARPRVAPRKLHLMLTLSKFRNCAEVALHAHDWPRQDVVPPAHAPQAHAPEVVRHARAELQVSSAPHAPPSLAQKNWRLMLSTRRWQKLCLMLSTCGGSNRNQRAPACKWRRDPLTSSVALRRHPRTSVAAAPKQRQP